MTTYIIKDWASNTLQFTGKFSFCYGNDLGVPMTFNSWEEAEGFLSEKLGDNYEEDRQEYYIIDNKGQSSK